MRDTLCGDKVEQIFQMARRWSFKKPGPENDALFKAAITEALRAAEQVPVIGDPVASMVYFKRKKDDRWDFLPCLIGTEALQVSTSLEQRTEPLYRAPTTFITAAELEALRKDAELLNSGCILTNSWDNPGEKVIHTGCNLRAAIGAAIAQGKGE